MMHDMMERFSWLDPTVENDKKKVANKAGINTVWLCLYKIWILFTSYQKSNYLSAGFNFMELKDSQTQCETDFFLNPQRQLKAHRQEKYIFQKVAKLEALEEICIS